MNHFNFYKENYYKEFEEKENLTKNISNSITIQVIIGGIISFLIADLTDSTVNIYYYLFLIFFVVGLLAFVFSIYFVIRSMFNYLYMFLPATIDLKKYHDELLKYYADENNGLEKANTDFENYVMSQYIENQKVNFENNSKKSKFIHLANKTLIISIAVLFFSLIPFSINKYIVAPVNSNIQDTTQKVIFIGDSIMAKNPNPSSKPKPTPPPSVGRKDGNISKPKPSEPSKKK